VEENVQQELRGSWYEDSRVHFNQTNELIMTFSLSTLRHNGRPTPVIETQGRYYPLASVAPELVRTVPSRGLMNLFDDWASAEVTLLKLAERLERSHDGTILPEPDDFMTPLQYPNKLILGGANYYEHMHKDAKMPDFRKENAIPVFFLKAPTTSLVGSGKTVRYPTQSKKVDWEVELALVIGQRTRRIAEADALKVVAGYAVGLDLSARDWQFHPKHPFKFDLFGGKAFDDSCPVGPKIVPARFVDSGNLRISLSVNGETKQDANTSDMIWSVAEEIASISEHMTLEPGDIVLTGTPAGVGMATNTYLKTGDKIDAEIQGLGKLSVEIVPDTDGA
jgi:2-keto-4-pentenoate hydratase/2-oxohepta-3-ene-1,7-dioic acid hydratase in catechol pathway